MARYSKGWRTPSPIPWRGQTSRVGESVSSSWDVKKRCVRGPAIGGDLLGGGYSSGVLYTARMALPRFSVRGHLGALAIPGILPHPSRVRNTRISTVF